MDTLSTTEAAGRSEAEGTTEPFMDPPPAIGGDERRMHVRAYNFWASLLNGRIFPSISDLDPASIGDFGPHGVLLDFRVDAADPAIPWIGHALRDEGGHSQPVATLADVPGLSLLSRLTDHFAEVVANRAPIGFEAEFTNVRGNHALYRGILMPFSSDGTMIDYIYGVINWKEVADAAIVAGIAAEVARAPAPALRPSTAVPAWADGPSRPSAGRGAAGAGQDLADLLLAACEGADVARSTEMRARTALYRALGLAYDVLVASEAAAGADSRHTVDAPAGRQRIATTVRQVFGLYEPSRRRSDYALALSHGLRAGVGPGGLRMLLERREGGLAAVVAEERLTRRTPPGAV